MPDMAKHIGHHTLAGKAASPWISTGSTLVRASMSRNCHCLARALPSTTGLTISRCDGFGVSERWTFWPSNSRSEEAPR